MTTRPLPLRPLFLPARFIALDNMPSLPGPFRIVALALRFGPGLGPPDALTQLLDGGVVRLFASERGVLSLPLSSIRPLASAGVLLSDGIAVALPGDGLYVGHGRAMPLPAPIDVAVGEVLFATVAVGEGECPDVPLELVVVCEAAEAKGAT